MRIFLATHHLEINNLIEKLESEKGIKELEKSLKITGLSQWAKPLLIVDEALYRERLIEKAKASKPDVILLYDKLPGTIEMEILLEEIRLEICNERGNDTRVILVTSLEQGAPLLRKAVEIGIWDIVSGKDVYPTEIIKSIYKPVNFSDAARYRLAPECPSQIKLIPKYIEKEKIVKVPEIQKIEVTKVVEKRDYVQVGNVKGLKEVVLFWSPFETGKTFLAVNLAAALSDRGFRTVLIDANLENSILENYFQVKSEERYVFIKSMKERSPGDEILSQCHKYNKYLYVLSLPEGKAEIPEVTLDDFLHLYDALRLHCDIFIIDGSKNLDSPLTRAVLKIASRVITVITPDPNRIKSTRIEMEKLAAQGMSDDKFELVLNKFDGNEELFRDITGILTKKLIPVTIPAILESAYKSIWQGIPAYSEKRTGEAFKFSINNLANYLHGSYMPKGEKERKRGVFNIFSI